MGIVNRSLDTSEQRQAYTTRLGLTETGTFALHIAPYPQQLQAAQIATVGVCSDSTKETNFIR